MITQNQRTINLLPEHIIDQIKAGEVLERPASLLKELIENSIDAGSNSISIHFVENGMDLLSIEDDGKGMSFNDLPFAFLRHATSKIGKFEDLYSLYSYGFRGEALASIAASARVTCVTQPRELETEGGKIVLNGGKEELLIPMKQVRGGTSIFIKDLFFNTPARLKFIKSKQSEKNQIKKILNSFLLSHPEIEFIIKWDDKEKEVYKRASNDRIIDRINDTLFSKKKSIDDFFIGSEEYDGHKIRIYLSKESFASPPNRHQYLFANNRLFYDRNIHQAILRAMDQVWQRSDSGHYLVFIDSPPEEIDVNIHPNKTQIKFSKSEIIYSLLTSTIKNAIKKNNILPTKTQAHFLDSNTETLENILEHTGKNTIPQYYNQTNFNLERKIENNELNFIPLDGEYFLFQIEKTYFLSSAKKAFLNYLSSIIEKSFEKEDQVSPLLVSEPFNYETNIDPYFHSLKKLGFEFDRINNQTIVLRTIPRLIHRNTITLSANILIGALSRPSQKIFDIEHFLLEVKKFHYDGPIDSKLIFTLFENNLVALSSISKRLDKKSLENFFYE